MLTLTENAAVAVKKLTAQLPQVGPDGGLRIRDTGSADSVFELTVAPTPAPEDSIVETAGARIFVDAESSTVLDDRVLDAEIAEDGSVRFALGTRT